MRVFLSDCDRERRAAALLKEARAESKRPRFAVSKHPMSPLPDGMRKDNTQDNIRQDRSIETGTWRYTE
jgi:hypothetical protein